MSDDLVDASARLAIVRERDELRAENDRLRGVLRDIAESDCWYGDDCPVFGSRHGQCTFCVAKEALGSTPSVSPADREAARTKSRDER